MRTFLLILLVAAVVGCTNGAESTSTTVSNDTTTSTAPSATDPDAESQEVTATDVATLTVTGEGIAYGIPDRISVMFAVSVLRPDAADAASVAAQVATNVRRALIGAGVAAEDIQTSDYTVMSEYRWNGDTRSFEGFRVRHSYRVKMPFDIAGRAIDAAYGDSWDALEVEYTQLYIEDDTALKAAARVDAWADCEETARQLAANAGMRLGRLASVIEGHESTYFGAELGADGEGDGTVFEPGRIAVHATIEAIYELAP